MHFSTTECSVFYQQRDDAWCLFIQMLSKNWCCNPEMLIQHLAYVMPLCFHITYHISEEGKRFILRRNLLLDPPGSVA